MSSPFASSSARRRHCFRARALGRALARALGWLPVTIALVLAPAGCRHADTQTSLRIEVPQADRDADLYVDGHYVGQVGAVGKEPVGPVLLAPGVHRVELRKPGRFPVQRTVRVDEETPAETVLEAELLEDPQ